MHHGLACESPNSYVAPPSGLTKNPTTERFQWQIPGTGSTICRGVDFGHLGVANYSATYRGQFARVTIFSERARDGLYDV